MVAYRSGASRRRPCRSRPLRLRPREGRNEKRIDQNLKRWEFEEDVLEKCSPLYPRGCEAATGFASTKRNAQAVHINCALPPLSFH
jgi:hypothetical protein